MPVRGTLTNFVDTRRVVKGEPRLRLIAQGSSGCNGERAEYSRIILASDSAKYPEKYRDNTDICDQSKSTISSDCGIAGSCRPTSRL